MTSTTCYVPSGADDWDDGSATATTITARANNSVDPPEPIQDAYFNIDTSAIPDADTVSSATLYWYDNAYTASKGVTRVYNIAIWNNTSEGFEGCISGTYSGSAGWKNGAIPSERLASNYINKTGNTLFILYVVDPGGSYYRSWTVRAYEYVTSPNWRAYLVVTHAPAAGGVSRVSLLASLGVG